MVFIYRKVVAKYVCGLLMLAACLLGAGVSSAQSITWYRDVDGDGWGTSLTTTVASSQPVGYVLNNSDCNDNNANTAAWVNTGATSFSQYDADYTAIAIDNSGIPYVAYNDNTTKGSVQKYTSGTWSYVGPQKFTAGNATFISFLVSSTSNTPYMFYRDNGYQASMMRYTSGSWSYVGSQAFTPGDAQYTSMALGTNDTPFAAFRDGYYLQNNKASVMKYDGSNWVNVGLPGFTSGEATYISLAVYGSVLYIAFVDGANSNKVTVMRSYTSGATGWSLVGAAGISAGSASYVSLAVDNAGNPVVGYRDNANSSKVTVRRFSGGSWTTLGSAGFSAGSVEYLSLAVDNARNPYVAYKDNGNSSKLTVMKYNGSGWGNVVSAGISSGSINYTGITLNRYGIPYVAYKDASNKISVLNLEPEINYPTVPTVSASPSITCSTGSVTLTVTSGTLNDATNWKWYTGSCGGTPIGTGTSISPLQSSTTTYYVRGENGCTESNGVCGFAISTVKASPTWYKDNDGDGWGNPGVTTVSCTQPATYVANKIDCNDAVFTNTQWYALGTGPASTQQCLWTSIAIDGNNVPYVGFYENYSRGSVMKFSGGVWSYVGNQQFTAGAIQYASMAVDAAGTPYLGYQDAYAGTSVMQYNGSSWVNVGTRNFSLAGASYQSLAIAPNGTPYIAYCDAYYLYNSKATVMMYDGSSWVPVGGTPGVTSGQATHISLAIDGGGTPYIAYCDGANSSKLSVMKYNGSAWVLVGTAGISAGSVSYVSLALDDNGVPYVAYRDAGNSSKATVMKWNGSSWATVGSAGFTSGSANYTSLAVTGSNLYLAYSDGANSNKATVMKWNGSSWAVHGTSAFSNGAANYTSVAVDAFGIPVIAFQDNGSSNQFYGWKAGPIAVAPTTPATMASPAVTPCGGPVSLTASGTLNGADNWYWYSGSCGGSGTLVGVGASITAYPTENTTYYARGDGGCLTTPGMCGNVSVTTTASPPIVATISGPTTLCSTGFIVLSNATPGGIWSSSNTSRATVEPSNGTVYGRSNGSLTITYTVSNACGTAYKTLGVNVNGSPSGITGGTDVCEGSTKTLASSGTGTWTTSNTTIATVVASTGIVTGVADGDVIITYTLSSGCNKTLNFTVNPQPSAILGNSSPCSGTTTTLSNLVSAGTWSSSNALVATISTGTGVLNALVVGTTRISYVLPTGCFTTATVTVYSTPVLTSATNGGPICSGATLTLSANAPVNVTGYSWAGPAAITNANTASASVPAATTAASGTYTVTLTNGSGGCTSSYTTTATVKTTPTAAPTNNGPICSGGTVTLTANPGANTSAYAWSGPNLSSSISQNPTATPTSSATYSLTVSDGSGNAGCSPATLYTTTVVVNSVPTAAPTNNGPVCGGGTVTLTANPGGSTNGYTWSGPNLSSTTVQNPTATPAATTVYSLTVRYNTGLSGCSPSTIYTTTVNINAGSTWQGTTSTNWFTAGNWCGGVPTTTSVVTIPNGMPRYPVITTSTASVRHMTIESAASVQMTGGTIQISGTVTTTGTFSVSAAAIVLMNGSSVQNIYPNTFADNTIPNITINNAAGVVLGGPLNVTGVVRPTTGNLNSAGYLTLVSTATQTGLINASGSGTVTGNMTLQRYIPKGFGYKYVSTPFTANTVGDFASYVDLGATFPTFYLYNENKVSSGWTTATTATIPLDVMEGYAANFGTSLSPVTVSLTGVANNGTRSTVLYNNNRTYTTGFNLVGNPYPSPINWTAASGWTKTNIDNAIYYFNASDTNQYTGSYSSFVGGVSSDGVASNIIPSMQGFFVHVSNGSYPVTATLGTTNAVRSYVLSPNPVYHRTTGAGDHSLFRLDAGFASDGFRSDPTVLYLDDNANGEFNSTTDALKLDNTDADIPNLYSLSKDLKHLSIQAIKYQYDSINIIPLGVQTERGGRITFSARNVDEMPAEMHIWFYDSKINVVQDMRSEPKYEVSLSAGKQENRFYLMFTNKDKGNLPVFNGGELNAYTSGKSLFIYLLSNIEGDVTVTNVLGQVVAREKIAGAGYHEMKLTVPAGIYIATFYSSMGKQSKKVFIGNE